MKKNMQHTFEVPYMVDSAELSAARLSGLYRLENFEAFKRGMNVYTDYGTASIWRKYNQILHNLQRDDAERIYPRYAATLEARRA